MTKFSTSPIFYKSNLLKTENGFFCEIGNDVWVGSNVLIKGGIKIGDGAIIGMGAVVTKDVPLYAVVVGVPAKVLKYRFKPETISLLLASRWWEKGIKELLALAKEENSIEKIIFNTDNLNF